MRFAVLSFVFALLVASAMAVAPLKSVIVSYPKETPQRVVDEAMQAIEKLGGQITHKYNIIKGFAANAPAAALEKVQVLNTKFNALIEEDGIVTTQNQGKLGQGH